ncbi:MAG: hypothetical protein PWQ11_608 [Candidatus Diapherotrites archaeon]|nr:hypothetical protein [Candidatus Diapherotrites archaeon]
MKRIFGVVAAVALILAMDIAFARVAEHPVVDIEHGNGPANVVIITPGGSQISLDVNELRVTLPTGGVVVKDVKRKQD